MALVAAEKFVYVTIVFEGGVVVDSIVNQSMSGEMKEAVGETLNMDKGGKICGATLWGMAWFLENRVKGW